MPETAGMMRWLVSYADFITLLSAIFFVWFATARVDVEKFQKFVQGFQDATNTTSPAKGGEGLLNQTNARTTIKPPLKPVISQRERVAEKVRKAAELAGLAAETKVIVNERGVIIRLMTEGTQPLFDLGRADLQPKAREILKKISWIVENEKIHNPIRIEGHTDNLPIHTAEFPSNWELSTRRATNVLRFLIQMGINPAQLQAAGYADTKPLAPNRPGGTPENRRVEIILLMGKS